MLGASRASTSSTVIGAANRYTRRENMPRALKAVFPMYWKWTTAAGARCWACPAVALPGRVAVAAPGGPGAARLFPQQPIRSLFRCRRVFRIDGWQAKGLLAG